MRTKTLYSRAKMRRNARGMGEMLHQKRRGAQKCAVKARGFAGGGIVEELSRRSVPVDIIVGVVYTGRLK